jgi:hypothetical protein
MAHRGFEVRGQFFATLVEAIDHKLDSLPLGVS